jgi:lysophosphatidylcholine acyltransferase/lyso-PAF acetyltransferase
MLGVLSVLVLPFKVLGAASCLVSFYLFCRLSILIPEEKRSNAVAGAGKIACRLCLLSLGFLRVRWINMENRPGVEPVAIVSNHCSWLDILVHMSRFFPSFVARDSTKDLPLVGLISKKMGCLFVDRERKGTATQGVGGIVKERISRAAKGEAGGQRPMLLFPEGTTTNGRYLLPFRTGAFLAGSPVQPVVLEYHEGRVSPAWESMDALHHVWLILTIPIHRVTAIQLPVYTPSKEEVADPTLYASNVRKYMLEHGQGLRPSTSTLAEKREFHELLKSTKPRVTKKVE